MTYTISPNVEESHWLIHLNLPKTTFEKKSRQYESFGFGSDNSDSVRLGRKRFFSGVWVHRPKTAQPLVLSDARLPVSGEVVVQFVDVDTFTTEFLSEYNVADTTVALMYRGRRLYVRGFG